MANTDDFIWRIAMGSTAMGGYNEDETEKWLFLADTNILSETVIRCLQPTEQSRCINLMDGLAVGEI
jgi:hypothetical protein